MSLTNRIYESFFFDNIYESFKDAETPYSIPINQQWQLDSNNTCKEKYTYTDIHTQYKN